MKRITFLLIFVLLFLFTGTQEHEKQPCKVYVIGRFAVEETVQGYKAHAGGIQSPYMKTMYLSIEYIIKTEK